MAYLTDLIFPCVDETIIKLKSYYSVLRAMHKMPHSVD